MFGGRILAAATIDHLMHHGHVFYPKGTSWRLRRRVLEAQKAGGVRLDVERGLDAVKFSPPSYARRD